MQGVMTVNSFLKIQLKINLTNGILFSKNKLKGLSILYSQIPIFASHEPHQFFTMFEAISDIMQTFIKK